MCARKVLQHNEDERTALGVCGNGFILLNHSGNVVTRIGIQSQSFGAVIPWHLRLFILNDFKANMITFKIEWDIIHHL